MYAYKLLDFHKQSIISLRYEIMNASNYRVEIMARMLDDLSQLAMQISELNKILSAVQ